MSLGRRVMTGAYINGHVDKGNKGDEVLARYDVNMRKDIWKCRGKNEMAKVNMYLKNWEEQTVTDKSGITKWF